MEIKEPTIVFPVQQEDVVDTLTKLYQYRRLVKGLISGIDKTIKDVQNCCSHPEKTHDYHGFDGHKTYVCDVCGHKW
jgi:hypothetical protein